MITMYSKKGEPILVNLEQVQIMLDAGYLMEKPAESEDEMPGE